jgi:hypothetical protein
MEEPKSSDSRVPEENTEPDNIYVGADGTEEVPTRENRKRFKVIFRVLQKRASLLWRPYFLE